MDRPGIRSKSTSHDIPESLFLVDLPGVEDEYFLGIKLVSIFVLV